MSHSLYLDMFCGELLLWDRSFYECSGVQTSVCRRAKPFRVVAPQRSKDYFALLLTRVKISVPEHDKDRM